ncbi:MAG: putative transporter [Acidobacteriaceae bacterium]|nr:putative transporter [Acidobacteriaceae bacterium]
MHSIWLIARREYLERVRTKAFIVSTILIPLLLGGGFAFSILKGGRAKSAAHIAVVSADHQLALDLQDELSSGKHSQMTVEVLNDGPTTRKTLDGELASGDLNAYLWVTPADAPGGRPTFSFTTGSKADVLTQGTVESALRTVLIREQLNHRGMVAHDVDALLQPIALDTSQQGKHASGIAAYVGVVVMFLLMYMVVMLYGMNVARSIIEEKTSRVFEVLLSTITAEQMLAGKILGVGAVGLTQILIWLTTAVVLGSSSLAAAITGSGAQVSLSFKQVIFFILYFIFGYLLYSSIAAALGAMVNAEQELQQLNMFLVMPLAACMFALTPVVTNPDSTFARIMSLIPFCSPLIMYLRISMGHPQAWEIALSFVLMTITIYAILWVASRIYRVGVLMYGKRPNLPEILRWLKYS